MEQTKSSTKWVWWLIGIIIVIILVLVSNNPTETGPLKIGFIAPLSGDAAAYGEVVKNSVELAVNEINQAGGINGRQIQMIYEDGKCDGQDGASAAQKLVDIDKVKYIIGGFCSGEVFSEIPITDPAKVFVISPGASAAKLSGISPYFIRNSTNDAIAGSLLADFLSSKSYKRVAIISEQTDYAQGIRDVFAEQAKKDNLNIVDDENYNSDTTDFRSLLLKIKSQNPDVIFMDPQTAKNLLNMSEQARGLGINAQFVGSLFGPDPTIINAGSATEGTIVVDVAGLSTDQGKTFLTKYQNTYNSAPNFPYYDGAAFDDVYLINNIYIRYRAIPVSSAHTILIKTAMLLGLASFSKKYQTSSW